MMNSNDIFQQIGLILSPKKHHNHHTITQIDQKPIFLQIELGQDQKHLLQVNQNQDPNIIASKFCHQHRLNKLAVSIIQQKIIQAKRHQKISQSSFKSQQKKENIRHNNQVKTPENQKNKNSNNVSRSVTPQRNKSKTKGTEGLYLRGMLRNRMQEEEKARKKIQQDQKQQQGLTFKPQINKVSEKIVEFLRENNYKKEKKKSPPKKMYDQLKQCTFKPKINKISQRIYQNRDELEKQRQREKEIMSKSINNKTSKAKHICEMQDSRQLFKPKINPKSSQKVTMPFFQRLDIALQKKNKTLTKSNITDEEECSFQPKIGRGPRANRNKQNGSIWEHLYNNSKKDCEKEKQRELQQKRLSQMSSQNLHSHNYYENLVQQRIKEVFTTLDSDFDGIISPQKIGIQFLPTSTLIFLKPIFMEMDSINACLNYVQFKRAVVALMADSDPGTKGEFISQKWKKQEQNPQFKPKINKRSKELANNRSVQNLYKEGLKEKQNRQYRLERERALRQQKQLQQCSFKPTLNHSSKLYMNKIAKKKNSQKTMQDMDQLIHSFMNQSQD